MSACVVLGACGGSRTAPSAEATKVAMYGDYGFTANPPNQLIRGTIRVNAEGTGIQFETACQPEVTVRPRPRNMPASTSVMTYYCSGTWLSFDKSNPAQAKWFASVEVPRRREICNRYETQNGRQVCVSRGTETYTTYEQRSGGIQVSRIP
jgi:hypothetical protein